VLKNYGTGGILLLYRSGPDDSSYRTFVSRLRAQALDWQDLLAHRYLGRADLWGLICDYHDLFFPLEPGTVLRIPSPDHVYMRLLA
jgi:hypothetical protein